MSDNIFIQSNTPWYSGIYGENDTTLNLAQLDTRYLRISGGAINGNLTLTGNLTATNITGTLLTASQPNITSIGTLTSLNSSGIATITNTRINTSTNYNGVMDTASVVLRQTNNINGNKVSINFSISTNVIDAVNTATCSISHERIGVYQGDLIFSTKRVANSTSALVEALRISSTGSCSIANTSNSDFQLNLGSSGTGINTSSITSTSITGTAIIATSTLEVNGVSINSSNLAYLSSITPGTVTASKALVVDGNKDISAFRNVFATKFCNNASYSSFAIDMGNTAADRLLAVFENGTAFYGLGANSSRLQLHSASGAGIRMYTNSSVGATGTQIFDINSAGLITADSITLDTTLTVPLAHIRDNAQTHNTRLEYLSLGRSSSGSDHGAYSFMNYYSSSTQGDSNYITFGPRLRTGLTDGWGMVMTQNGNVSFQDKNANGGAGGFKIQSNIIGTVDIQGGITRTIGAGNGELRANATPAIYNAGTVSTRISLWVENSIWCGDKIYTSSDIRLKRNITSIPLDEAKKLLNVRAVSYQWKKDTEDNMPEVGCIAQELLEAGLAPLVSFCPNNDKENFPEGYQLGLQYSRLPIYMIELIKDLYAQIEELKKN